MEPFPFTRALELLLSGHTVRRALPRSYILRAYWQPAIPQLGMTVGNVHVGYMKSPHPKENGNPHLCGYTFTDEDRAGLWVSVADPGGLMPPDQWPR